jgi:4-hydroxybenzoyl-CoA reductase alpha subunit
MVKEQTSGEKGMVEYSLIGKRLPKVDGVAQATGEAKYTGDIVLPRMLFGKILRSPYPHALILNIDTGKATKLFGVKAVMTGKDIKRIKVGIVPTHPETMDEYPLAVDKVRYIGDPIAAVAAIDEEIAEEALDLIKVEYEELPAVFNPEEAMKPGAPIIHEYAKQNIGFKIPMEFGDVEKGFRDSYYVREDRFTTQAVQHCQLEPHTAVSSFDSSGKLTIWDSTQTPWRLQKLLARTLEIPEDKVRVIKPYVGGGFGGKNELFASNFCSAFLSRKTKRPVKVEYSREEVFSATRQRHPTIIDLKTGVKKDGTLLASQCREIADGGAYHSSSPAMLGLAGAMFIATYKIPNVKFNGYIVYTNKSIRGALRGHGAPQMRFAFDSQLDMIAEELGIDPVDIRLKNAFQPGDVAANKFEIGGYGMTECIKKAAEWRNKKGSLPKNRGIGMSGTAFVCGAPWPFNVSGATVRVQENGAVTLITGASDIGQGSNSVLCQIAAEELGVGIEDIRITSADTELAPPDPGTFSSRVTTLAGNAVRLAAQDAKKQLFEVAAEKLEANINDLEAKNRQIYVKGSPEKGIRIADVVQGALHAEDAKLILGKGFYSPKIALADIQLMETGGGNLSSSYSAGCQIAEVEVDPDTGMVEVTDFFGAHDIGRALNPSAAEGQYEGGIQMGLGYALSEELVYNQRGLILNPSFLDYGLLTAMDMPKIEISLVETVDTKGPYGAKEAGEGSAIPTAAAIANAIYNAVGVRIKDLPITPEKILEALQQKKRDQQRSKTK